MTRSLALLACTLWMLQAAAVCAQDVRDVVRDHLEQELEHKPEAQPDKPRPRPRPRPQPMPPPAAAPAADGVSVSFDTRDEAPAAPEGPHLPQRLFERYVQLDLKLGG